MRPTSFKSMLVAALLMASSTSVFAAVTSAQVETQTTTTTEAGSKTVKVEKGEVVYVSGNDLVVKSEDGTLRHFNNVPESAKVTVDGQQLGIHDLKPGMKLQRTITTTTTPRTVTTTKSVTGTVWHVTPPLTVILTMEDGKNQQFTIPKGQKFNVDGQMVDAFGLKKGMKISATKVVEVPETIVTQNRKVTGTMPPPPPPPPADQPVLIVVVNEPAPAPVAAAAAEPAPAALPKTASSIPLLAAIGLCFIAMAFGVKLLRRSLA
jgi:hypothetical protein